MDGLTATRMIRAAAPKSSPPVPIIAMTANVLPDQIARCLEAGANDHVGKPVELAKLLSAIDRWVSTAMEAAE
jgi:CheY-like chemotaxis protein